MSTIKEKDMTRVIEIEKGRTVKNIEVSDGKVVINYEKTFFPKDGDFVYTRSKGVSAIFILKGDYDSEYKLSHASLITYYRSYPMLHTQNVGFRIGDSATQRIATESEKQQLIDALAKDGLTWNAEKKVVEKLRWRPKVGEKYFLPNVNCDLRFDFYTWNGDEFDKLLYRIGIIYKTQEDAQCASDRLKQI